VDHAFLMKRKQILILLFIILPPQLLNISAGKFSTINEPSAQRFFTTLPSDIDLKDIKQIPDLYFECSIAQMNDTLKIPLFYDPLVREYIEIYLLERPNLLPLIDARSETFFPVFEKYLSEYNLPPELKYIPVIESGLECLALSPSGALGLWQFIPETGRAYGLLIKDGFDERINPEKSTQAACEYIASLYHTFGNWQLTLLAFHAGPTTIKNAVIKAGGKTTYKAIFPNLPLATKRYLPAYIASMYVLNHYKKHI
jgi:membrane-bound lytic murein transglycosylase D